MVDLIVVWYYRDRREVGFIGVWSLFMVVILFVVLIDGRKMDMWGVYIDCRVVKSEWKMLR